MKGLIIFLVAILLGTVLIPVGIIYSLITLKFRISQYFYSIAIAIDQMGNVIMQDLFNWLLIRRYYITETTLYEQKCNVTTYNYALFGNEDETISSVLGKNELQGSLTKMGKALNWILNLLEKNHATKAIEEDETNNI